jgi:hypothetical protein
MNPGKKVFQTKPPDKGSFPLDHDGKGLWFRFILIPTPCH